MIIAYVFSMFGIPVYAVLSDRNDISSTELGQSIVGNVYETLTTISIIYSSRNKKGFNLSINGDSVKDISPEGHEFYIKIPSGIKFKVIEVKESYVMGSGTKLNIVVKLLDNMQNESILEYIEADKTDDFPYRQYITKDILESINPVLSKIYNKDSGLKTKNLNLELYCSEFFDYDKEDVKNKNSIKHNETIIKQIK